MKNILLISSTSKKRNRLDGVTIKSRVLEEALNSSRNIKLYSIDADNYKKEPINIIYSFIKNYKRSDKIVICGSAPGAAIILKFLKLIKSKKEVYYFVAGGVLVDYIKEGKYNVELYKNIKKIYVESNKMVEGFKELGIKNVEKMNNFRNVENFTNNYTLSPKVRFVYYGRVIREKGVVHAINLINRLSKDGYDVCLDIYGQCNEDFKKELEYLITSDVKICGPLVPNNKYEYETLSKYDIFIFPTEYEGEGMPGALIDAYIAELAIVASNWEYANECIIDGKNGCIFEYKNYNDMYNKTKEIIKSNKIKDFKKQSKELSKQYLTENVLNRFISEIES